VNPRSESLLWLQLLGLAAIPAELLALVLVLAGADPGPFPGLERLLAWALGALLPAVLLWRRPADVWSLLFLQIPLRGRRELQRRLSALQSPLPVKLLGASAALLLLPAVWLLDGLAGQAAALSPLGTSSRLVGLLLAVPLLAVMLWQWQQAIQAIWLLIRPAEVIAAARLLSLEILGNDHLSLGLPLLLPAPLALSPQPATVGVEERGSAVAPEQQPEQKEGTDLDEQVG
jgi:hypothetical protein